MAATLETRIALEIQLALLEGVDLGTRKFEPVIKRLKNLGSGAGLDQASQLFTDTRSLAGSATEDLDFASGGGLVDQFGVAIAFTKLKLLYVSCALANLNNLEVVSGAAGIRFLKASGDAIIMHPDSYICLVWPTAGGITVTPTTADLITFTNAAPTNTISYDVVAVGA